MAVPFSNTKLRVPRGFQNLLEGLAREVLRSQPEELYTFGAQYFEALIKQREESGVDPTEHGAKMEDRFYNNKAFTEPEIDPSDPTQQDAALAIQTKFRQHAAKQEVEVIREDKAATKIQAGFRGHQGRTQSGGEIESEEAKKDAATEEEKIDIDLNDPDVEAAAIKIQASFKGFQTRKTVTKADPAAAESFEEKIREQTPPKPDTEEVDIDLSDPDVENAAIKIQAGFKGMKARQRVRNMKGEGEEEAAPVLLVAEKYETYEYAVLEKQPETVMLSSAPEIMEKAGCSAPEREDLEPEECHKMSSAVEVEYELKPVVLSKAIEQDALAYDTVEMSKDMSTAVECQPELEVVHHEKISPRTGDVKVDSEGEKDTVKTEHISPPADEIDIDLTDPEVENAALKIQAGFKGMKTRQALKDKKGSGKSTEPEANEAAAPTELSEDKAKTTAAVDEQHQEEIDIDLGDPEVEAAAIKIQAGFKGFQARKSAGSKPGSAGRAASAQGMAETEQSTGAEPEPATVESTSEAAAAETKPAPDAAPEAEASAPVAKEVSAAEAEETKESETPAAAAAAEVSEADKESAPEPEQPTTETLAPGSTAEEHTEAAVEGPADAAQETTKSPVPNTEVKPETQPEEKPATPPAEKPASPPVEKPATPPAEKPATPPAEKPTTPPAEKPATPPAEKPATPPVGTPAE